MNLNPLQKSYISEKKEILVIEDSESSMQMLTDLLTKHDYAVRQAQDWQMANISLRNKKPDLILLDVRMPGVDGFEACRILKSDADTQDIPIIFLSALQDSEAKVEGLKLGAADYIVKPFDPQEVLLRVKTVLELKELQNNLENMCLLRTQQLQQEINERKRIEAEVIENRDKLRELTGHLEDVREQERKRIARDIHDQLGQSLTVARMDLTRIQDRCSSVDKDLHRDITQVIDTLQEASDIARSISEGLRPGILDLLGLGAAVEHHTKRFREATGVDCHLTMSNNGEFEVGDKVATAAFRIIQESLTNVARHAKATQAQVHVVDLGTELLIIIQDDGVGINNKDKQNKNSFGLIGMNERVQLLGGELSIESEPSEGTRIEATLPYSTEFLND